MKPAPSRPESRRSPSGATLQSVARNAPSRSESLASVASTTSRQYRPPVSATPSVRSLHAEQSAHKTPSAGQLPKKPVSSKKATPTRSSYLVSKKIQISAKRRAEGRVKVPQKIRGSFKEFCFSSNGVLKVLRMCIIAASVFCFIIGGSQDMFIAITIQETCIVLFFIIIYLTTLQHLLICVHWPLLDLINSLISAVFLGGVAVVTIKEKGRKQLLYIGGETSPTG
ncbi:CKLF-like MARVEL transmembrane domain-containing protein 1 [Acomys russatus]|uniref:CKLF-like MARVEL transmembrane domain-containing protein 1 n=1 Tax=Acomys russatus TaxID=60746 RepID=UPI0021E2D576|nr:CKLF-like MARVEL transmembrane domain-containing protein 1 [Acomys russatus]